MKIPYNAISGKPYQGRNVAELLGAGFNSPEWATFLQWKKAGYKVKKGSKGTYGITFGSIEDKDKNGKTKKESYIKGFVVFNREQVEKQDKNDLERVLTSNGHN